MVPGMFKVGADLSDLAYRWERGQDAIRQRKKAADAAFDKYLKDQERTASDEGIRKEDREAFKGMYNDLVKYGVENKKLINSNPSAKADFENRWKSLSYFAEDSKDAKEKEKPLADILQNKRDQIVEEDVIYAIGAHRQPLRVKDKTGAWVENPNRVEIDYTKDYFKPKPIDVPGLMQKWTYGKKPSETKGMPLKNDPNTPEGRNRMAREVVVQPITIGYSDKSIKEIGQVAEQSILLDAELATRFKKELDNLGKTANKNRYLELSAILDNKFPGETIDSPAKVAKAIALEAAINAAEVKEEEIEDKEARLVRQKRERAQSEARADARAAGGSFPVVFDVIDTTYSGGRIDDGAVKDKSGNLVTGKVSLSKSETPAQLSLAMKGLNIDVGFNGVDLEVENGVIKSVTPRGFTAFGKPSGRIDREAILIGQQKVGPKVNWGKAGKPAPKKKDSLGLGF